MLEHFGFERYLREVDAQELGRDECGILWAVSMPGDEPLVMVEVVNATPEPDGTRRTYFCGYPRTSARPGRRWRGRSDSPRRSTRRSRRPEPGLLGSVHDTQ